MGRPPLPPGAAKGTQWGVRFDAGDTKQISKQIDGTPQTPAQWVRDAARLMAAEGVVCDKFTVEELDTKKTAFRIFYQGRAIEGVGTLMALQRGDGTMKIQIESQQVDDAPDSYFRFLMPQAAVGWIQRAPSGSKVDFQVFDPSIRK